LTYHRTLRCVISLDGLERISSLRPRNLNYAKKPAYDRSPGVAQPGRASEPLCQEPGKRRRRCRCALKAHPRQPSGLTIETGDDLTGRRIVAGSKQAGSCECPAPGTSSATSTRLGGSLSEALFRFDRCGSRFELAENELVLLHHDIVLVGEYSQSASDER
jgi:hypothetical protein